MTDHNALPGDHPDQTHSWSADDDSARVTALEWRRHVEMVGRIDDRVEAHDSEIRAMVVATVEQIMARMPKLIEENARLGCDQALRTIADDSDWWRGNVRQIVKHATEIGNAWIGRKILLFLAGMAASALIVWMVQSGQLKK